MALNAYLNLTGETQGKINGSGAKKGREDSIKVIAANHEVVSPRDAASGLPSGKHQHKPFIITKEVDKSSPLLYQMLTSNENITEWELRFWRPSRSGKELQFFTVQLLNASIAGIHFEMLNNKYPENMQHREREHITFAYQKITWTWENGGISSEDDWEALMV
ncbi:MAG: type VI secretion system tube protein TssD [Xanthomonadales bacterium]|nr:type VI secretion system tube protein TssD [Xanthomonadales bacterium]